MARPNTFPDQQRADRAQAKREKKQRRLRRRQDKRKQGRAGLERHMAHRAVPVSNG